MDKEIIRMVSLQDVMRPGGQQCRISSKEVVTFILVARKIGSSDRWLAPATQVFHDFMGLVKSELFDSWREYRVVLDWCNTWSGTVGLLGLHSGNALLLEEFRKLLTTKGLQGWEFNTYPKEALVRSPQLHSSPQE